jgi:hypothetical protein
VFPFTREFAQVPTSSAQASLRTLHYGVNSRNNFGGVERTGMRAWKVKKFHAGMETGQATVHVKIM